MRCDSEEPSHTEMGKCAIAVSDQLSAISKSEPYRDIQQNITEANKCSPFLSETKSRKLIAESAMKSYFEGR